MLGETDTLCVDAGPKTFTFDHTVGPEGSQEMIFQMAGKPITKSCLQVGDPLTQVQHDCGAKRMADIGMIQGYNGTIFCYGQVRVSMVYIIRIDSVPHLCDHVVSCQ